MLISHAPAIAITLFSRTDLRVRSFLVCLFHTQLGINSHPHTLISQGWTIKEDQLLALQRKMKKLLGIDS